MPTPPALPTLTELIDRINNAMARADASGFHLSNAMTLATATKDGKPSARMVLLKHADADGFVFYTNLESQKAVELRENPQASLCFWWGAQEEQVRVDGVVLPVSDDEADAYFATRPRASQLAAWASTQSAPLEHREVMMTRYNELEEKHADSDVPRPAFWSGFRLVPARIEFWFGKTDRLHERQLYTRLDDIWSETLLYP